MGINMGIHVIIDREDAPTLKDDLETRFFEYVNARFPNPQDEWLLGGGWAHHYYAVRERDGWFRQHVEPLPEARHVLYDFDIRPFGRGGPLHEAGYTFEQVYEAILGFILQEFSYMQPMTLEPYWS